MKVLYATESNNKLKQLAKQFGRQKRVVVKYNGDFKYVHVYDNRKGAKYPGITLGHDEFMELMNIVKLINMADSFFKEKPLPSEVFKKRAGEMEIEHREVYTLNPSQPQDDMLPLHKKEEMEREHEEHGEQTLGEHETQINEEHETQTHEEHREQEHRDDVEWEHVDKGEMIDVEALLNFLKTIETSNVAVPVLESSTCCTPSTTDSTPLTLSTADTTPFASTSPDSLLLTPPMHINVEEKADIVPPNLTSTDAIIPTTHTHPHIDSYTPMIEPITPVKVKKGLKIKNPGFKKHRSFPLPSLPPYKN